MAWSPFSKKSGGDAKSQDSDSDDRDKLSERNSNSMKAQKAAPTKFATPFVSGKIGGMTGGVTGGKTGGSKPGYSGPRAKPGASTVKNYMPKGPSAKGK